MRYLYFIHVYKLWTLKRVRADNVILVQSSTLLHVLLSSKPRKSIDLVDYGLICGMDEDWGAAGRRRRPGGSRQSTSSGEGGREGDQGSLRHTGSASDSVNRKSMAIPFVWTSLVWDFSDHDTRALVTSLPSHIPGGLGGLTRQKGGMRRMKGSCPLHLWIFFYRFLQPDLKISTRWPLRIYRFP